MVWSWPQLPSRGLGNASDFSSLCSQCRERSVYDTADALTGGLALLFFFFPPRQQNPVGELDEFSKKQIPLSEGFKKKRKTLRVYTLANRNFGFPGRPCDLQRRLYVLVMTVSKPCRFFFYFIRLPKCIATSHHPSK